MDEYRIKGWAWLLSIIFAFIVEFYMIVVETYVNFITAFGILGGVMVYALVTLFTLLFLKIGFGRIDGKRFLWTYLIALIIVLPIGFFWGVIQGYDINSQLINIDWEFTHDMVYMVLVTQFIVLMVLLLGTKKLEDEDYYEEMGDEKSEWSDGWR